MIFNFNLLLEEEEDENGEDSKEEFDEDVQENDNENNDLDSLGEEDEEDAMNDGKDCSLYYTCTTLHTDDIMKDPVSFNDDIPFAFKSMYMYFWSSLCLCADVPSKVSELVSLLQNR